MGGNVRISRLFRRVGRGRAPGCNLVEALRCGLQQPCGWRGAVDGVDHDALRLDAAERLEPGSHVGLGGVVHRMALPGALHEERLHNDVPLEGFERGDDLLHVVAPRGTVDAGYVVGAHGVEFLYVVVDQHQCVVHGGTCGHGGVAQHAHFGLGEIAVAQRHGVGYDAGKVGVCRGLAVAGKGQHVGGGTVGLHLLQPCLKRCGHLLPRGAKLGGAMVGVEAAFAVQAVEGAKFAVGGHKVDAERHAKPAAVHRAEDGRGIDNAHGG